MSVAAATWSRAARCGPSRAQRFAGGADRSSPSGAGRRGVRGTPWYLRPPAPPRRRLSTMTARRRGALGASFLALTAMVSESDDALIIAAERWHCAPVAAGSNVVRAAADARRPCPPGNIRNHCGIGNVTSGRARWRRRARHKAGARSFVRRRRGGPHVLRDARLTSAAAGARSGQG